MSRKRSGFHVSASSPQTCGSLQRINTSFSVVYEGIAYLLYEHIDIDSHCPARMGIERIISPVVEMMGSDKGITSSFTASRQRLKTMGWNRSVSCRQVPQYQLKKYCERIRAHLDRIQDRGHRVEVVNRETRIAPSENRRTSRPDLRAHLCLILGMLRQFPEHPRKSAGGRFVAGEREALHLCRHLCVCKLSLWILRRVGFD